jgi:DNA repair protein RadC
MRYQRAESPARLTVLAAAQTFFANCFADSDPGRERLWVAHLDDEARCMQLSFHDGGAMEVDVPVRDIIRDAALLGSAGVVLAHNHPSGDHRPSDGDCRATRKLALAAEAIDLTIVDHLVFGGDGCSSFRRMGLL